MGQSSHVLHMRLENTLLKIDYIFLKFVNIICYISLHIKGVFYKLEKVHKSCQHSFGPKTDPSSSVFPLNKT